MRAPGLSGLGGRARVLHNSSTVLQVRGGGCNPREGRSSERGRVVAGPHPPTLKGVVWGCRLVEMGGVASYRVLRAGGGVVHVVCGG